ncbi:hypothetical protein [Enterovirga aerilata]|uniref:Uncharacterized protein n=1 Tax=Enterovirga aerilata TaxID=2730920 RepID=A0A849I6R9_9HYPH|nr:hypothetical protein [Enterovirga sp. DB1703]NNM73078.1 hypothetical protein [Enterovirga sp. DB1703]
MTKTLDTTLAAVAELPVEAQDQIGRELLQHVNRLHRLHGELGEGLRSLDAGEGDSRDVEDSCPFESKMSFDISCSLSAVSHYISFGNGRRECDMRLVRQAADGNDCGAACVAMLSRRPRAEAYAVVYPDGRQTSTSARTVRAALRELGTELAAHPRRFRMMTYHRLKTVSEFLATAGISDALLKVVRKENEFDKGHWVVWDSKRAKILNPLGEDRRLFRVVACYEVINPEETE